MSYAYQSADGLCRSNDPAHVAIWDSIGARMARDQEAANRILREQGVKAAHPDDGWVDRQKHTVQLVYPAFDDGVRDGDLIALGWPWKGYRIVRCTEAEHCRGVLLNTIRYHFEPDTDGTLTA